MRFDFQRLLNVDALVSLALVDGRVKEGVDERRLAQARFANNHQRKVETFLDGLAMDLVGQVVEANITV